MTSTRMASPLSWFLGVAADAVVVTTGILLLTTARGEPEAVFWTAENDADLVYSTPVGLFQEKGNQRAQSERGWRRWFPRGRQSSGRAREGPSRKARARSSAAAA